MKGKCPEEAPRTTEHRTPECGCPGTAELPPHLGSVDMAAGSEPPSPGGMYCKTPFVHLPHDLAKSPEPPLSAGGHSVLRRVTQPRHSDRAFPQGLHLAMGWLVRSEDPMPLEL
ncbi:hypothetical protein UY3_03865 [Chelonia mydas]|uniref:Uncharacterized protein n=1 Tax=Chelonia mydas TaxID=8469 RepID=M7C3B0_CHEMY|nr:hypothetical protein UY3_03865 [Chelonia mydas]